MKEIIGTLKEIKRKKFWQTLGIDLVFLIIVLVFAMIAGFLARFLNEQRILATVFVGIYLLALVGIYSFFKYKVLKILVEETQENWIRLYIFNFVFVLIFTVITFLSYLIITYFVIIEYHRLYFGIVLLLFFILGYIVLNIMQILRISGNSLEDSLTVLKKNILKFLGIFFLELLGLVVIYFIYVLFYNLIKGRFDINWIFQTITLVVLFFYNAFNRILFFNSCKAK